MNTAVFYYGYKDLQVDRILATLGTSIENAAAAKLYGEELEMNALPVVDLTLAVMKSQFGEFLTADPAAPRLGVGNLTENRLPAAPKYAATFSAEYAIQTASRTIKPRVESDTVSDIYFDQFNYQSTDVDGYTRFNAFLRYTSPDNVRYYGSLYIKNIANLTRVSGEMVGEGLLGFAFNSAFIPPRTYGNQVGGKDSMMVRNGALAPPAT